MATSRSLQRRPTAASLWVASDMVWQQPCLPLGSSEAEESDGVALREKRGMKHMQSTMWRPISSGSSSWQDMMQSTFFLPGTAEVSSNMCGWAERDRECSVGIQSLVTIHFPLSLYLCPPSEGKCQVLLHLTSSERTGDLWKSWWNQSSCIPEAQDLQRVPSWTPSPAEAAEPKYLLSPPHQGRGCPQLLQTKLDPGAETPWPNEHFLILVSIRHCLFSSPSGPICLLRLLALQKTRKSHNLPVQHRLQEGSCLCGAFGRYHNPNHECHFCVCLPFSLIFLTLIADRFS